MFRCMLILFCAVALLNPLFNARGETVLFTYFGDRPFTLEALLYGMATGGMFLSVLLWFACYNEIMTSDKFTYLFGTAAPAVSLVFCMVLRFVPHFKAKAAAVAEARRCIGKAPEDSGRKKKFENSMTVLSVLTSWALENAAATADSMKSRGYGAGTRTNFAIYRMDVRSVTLLLYLAGSAMATVAGAVLHGAEIAYLPVVAIPSAGTGTVIGIAGYAAFLAAPVVLYIWEEATWRILRSRI